MSKPKKHTVPAEPKDTPQLIAPAKRALVTRYPASAEAQAQADRVVTASKWREVEVGRGLAEPIRPGFRFLMMEGVGINVLAIQVNEPKPIDRRHGDIRLEAVNPEYQGDVDFMQSQYPGEELETCGLAGEDVPLEGRWLLLLSVRPR